ncbi:hypothetical protein [Micromonospora sp. CPCC 206061]|uniref:hypothetical protein n=1 Tax=Micromonospora sp. CPCC 206061 TaxID=3122410 RepID=UPI002FEFF41E
MKLKRLQPGTRGVIAIVAMVVALGAISLRAFVFRDHDGWYLLLWVLQGLAMTVAWVFWGVFRRRRHEQGVDMKAKRLHW